MPVMNLPDLPVRRQSRDEYVREYLERLTSDEAPWPHISLLLTAYMAWPKDKSTRNSFMATYLALFVEGGRTSQNDQDGSTPNSQDLATFGGLRSVAKPAFQRLTDEIAQVQRRWLLVADIFHKIVDLAYDDRIDLRGGPSISKAIELCEIEYTMPGHSQLRSAWTDFRDVAHLIAASASLAHESLSKAPGRDASILKALWTAPDAVVALASGFQEFWLRHHPDKKSGGTINGKGLWQIPSALMPETPFIVFRRLTGAQIEYLRTRRAPKKYEPTTTPHRVRK
jgi:hypothetical protein